MVSTFWDKVKKKFNTESNVMLPQIILQRSIGKMKMLIYTKKSVC